MKPEKTVLLADFVRELLPAMGDVAGNEVRGVGELSLRMLEEAIDYASYCGGVCFYEDPYLEPPEAYAIDVSSCIVKNGFVEGMLLIKKEKDDSLSPVLMFSSGDDVRLWIREMTAYSIRAASAHYPLRTPVTMHHTDPRQKELLSFLYGRKEYERIAGMF